MAQLAEIDDILTSPAAFARLDHYAALRRLRDEAPVHWTVGNAVRPFWSVTRHADCVRVLTDAATFSSDLGGIMPPTAAAPTAAERVTYGFGSLPTHMDPPRHQQIRRPFNKHFAVPTIQRLRQSVEDAVEAILDKVAPRGECDLVEDVAAQLPVHLIFAMMGVPEEDQPRIRHYCMAFGGAQDPAYQIDGSEAKTIQVMVKSLFDYMFDLAMRRRQDPRDDFTSVVGTIEVDGARLSDRDVGWWCLSFVLAGLETTRNALSAGFLELIRRPDQAARLRADPALMPLAAEEIVRFVSPSKHKFRIATRDCEIAGQPVREGDWVVAWLVSANRDETVFADADSFDVARNPNPHLGYSVGEHSCLGRHLARLEIQTMVPAVLARLGRMEVNGDIRWLASNNHTGLRKLPVRFAPSPARAGIARSR